MRELASPRCRRMASCFGARTQHTTGLEREAHEENVIGVHGLLLLLPCCILFVYWPEALHATQAGGTLTSDNRHQIRILGKLWHHRIYTSFSNYNTTRTNTIHNHSLF